MSETKDLFPNGWTQSTRYPDPAITALDPRFEKYWVKLACVERLRHRLPLGRRAGVVRRRRATCCGATFPTTASCKWDEETGAVSVFRKPSELRQRQHARPPGPAGHLRARRPAHHAHGVRRRDHRADRQLRRQAAQLAQRHRRASRTARSGSPIRRSASSATTRATSAEPELPTNVYRLDPRRPAGRRSSPTTSLGPTACASRRTRTMLYVVESRGAPDAQDPRLRRDRRRHKLANKRVFDRLPAPAARPTACAATSTATSGAAGAWARPSSTASWCSRPTASRSAASPCRSAAPTSASAARKRNRLFMAASQSLYALYVHAQGVPGS